MSITAPYRASARAQLHALRCRQITARSLLDQTLAHLAKVNPCS
ncbi:hypothetical protein ACFYOV_28445 [Streptomyces sp. NPDC005931]